ncbi:MAG: tRNA guanosine(34) transglycosylase Tgt [Phycisphaerales bacterium]
MKGLAPGQVRGTGSQIILNNAYHLLLHEARCCRRTGWNAPVHAAQDGPILTSRGLRGRGRCPARRGSDAASISEEVTFRSFVDKLPHPTHAGAIDRDPERHRRGHHHGLRRLPAVDPCPGAAIAGRLGDHAPACAGAHRRQRAGAAAARRHMRRDEQALFGIVQGGTDLDLRRASATAICAIDLPGYAIGGVAVGEGTGEIRRVVEFTAPLLPDDKPRYLMGVGYERDIVAAVAAGVDMFDCVLPTRNGRNALAFTRTGPIRLRNAKHRLDPGPIDTACDCATCRGPGSETGWPAPERRGEPDTAPAGGGFSRAYLRHLFMADEMLGPTLVSIHNIRHFQRLLLDIRRAIRQDTWSLLERDWPVLRTGAERSPNPP